MKEKKETGTVRADPTPALLVDGDAFATAAEWAELCRLIGRIAAGELPRNVG